MLSSFVKNSLVHSVRNKLLFGVSKTIGCPVIDVAATTSSALIISRRFISNRNEDQNSLNLPKMSSGNGNPANPNKNTLRNSYNLNTSELLLTTRLKSEYQELARVMPNFVRDLTDHIKQFGSKSEADWFEKSFKYNVPTGKRYRGLTTVLAFESFAKPEMITTENLKLARYLGWCVEMLDASLLLSDDIMDGGETRRGSPCWYKLDDVKMVAINDAFMMERGIFVMLKKYFSDLTCYVQLMELFHEILFITGIGQTLDLQVPHKSVDEFTMELYKTIIVNKAVYFSFHLPILLGMHLAEYTDRKVFQQIVPILSEMGSFLQIQNDFLDCFGDPNIIGKIGTDIRDGKCTWLSVVCMERANEEEKNIMRQNYGRNEPENIASIKQLYVKLGLPEAFAKYEESFKRSVQLDKIGKVYHDILNHFWFDTFPLTGQTFENK